MQKKKSVNLTPRILTSDPGYARKEAFKSVLPEGASLDFPRRTASFGSTSMNPVNTGLMGGGGSTMYHMQRPYHPELESPDRMQLPQDRKLQNDIWRLFHKFDGVFGPAMDMYAEMCVSDFDLAIDDESKEIKETLEYMNEITFLNEKLKFIIREYLVLGEAIPHLFFDDDLGIWTYIALHNPDNIEVKDTPFINTDPIINYIPDESLRALIQDSSKEAVELRQKLTPELVSKILARQKIRLSPTNCSFIARKLSPYDIRGTSLGTRLWRIFMIEDAAAASTIATYRRNAGALRCVKMGDPNSGHIPSPEIQNQMLELLAQAEIDPNAWLVHDYMVNFEAWGSNDKSISLGREGQWIDDKKLLALGLSKAFMTGDANFSSVKGGLQVFLRRLLSMRQYFEKAWLLPKYFRPISEVNDWVKPKQSEVAHQYRIKRTAKEISEENMWIIPKIKWRNRLDPAVDSEILTVYNQLKQAGVKISEETLCSTSTLDFQEEFTKTLHEFKWKKETEKKILGETMLGLMKSEDEAKGGAKPPGTPGAGAKPPSAAGKPPGGKPPVKPSTKDTGGAPGAAENGPMDDSINPPSTDGMPTV